MKKRFSNLYTDGQASKALKIYTAGFAIVLLAGVGANLQFRSYAATPVASVEVEAGNKVAPATLLSNASASGGAAVKFGSTVTAPTSQVMLMGVSDSPNDHGGTEAWDVWRVYNETAMLKRANATGNLRPKALAYSEAGDNLGGVNPDYNTIYNHVLDRLNSFYYTNTTGQTHSTRWNIKLFWSNGNEMMDKGALTLPHTANGIANFTVSQKALYDAVHATDSLTKLRRFPDAYAGSDPTHDAERSGIVQDWLDASAQYHDFVMWSMYPPGRKVTTSDPTFNWPTFNESQQTAKEGFLIRTFYRTKEAETHAGHPLMIAVGEIGIGNDPNDGTTRPYYVAYGLAHSLVRLSEQYDLTIPFACWWDNQTDSDAAQNILSDEQTSLNPTTRVAWQDWIQYDRLRGGTNPPSWAGNPKSTWKVTGTAPAK